MRYPRVIFCIFFILLLATAGFGQTRQARNGPGRRQPADNDCLIQGGVIHTMAGGEAVKADLLVRSGKIAAIGQNLSAPEGVPKINATGLNVLPGLIDAHSQFLLLTGSRATGKTEADVLDAFDFFNQTEMEWALARGVTSVALSPKSVTGFSGKIAVVKLMPGQGLENMVLKKDVALKAGLGINTLGKPITRIRSANALAKKFEAAKKYRETWEKYREELEAYEKKLAEKKESGEKPGAKEPEKKVEENKGDGSERRPGEGDPRRGRRGRGGLSLADEPEKKEGGGQGEKDGDAKKDAKKEELKKPKRPSLVPENEYLMKAMDGEMAVHLEVHHAADILRALEIKGKYHLDLVLVGCTEGYLVADDIKKAGVPVILGPVRRPAGREENEFYNHRADCAAILAARGIPIALAGSGRQPLETRFIALNAALAAGAGLCPGTALEAITVSAAAILGVKDSIGSLEKGKDADIVLVRGCPLESDGQVEKVLVNGKVVYSKTK